LRTHRWFATKSLEIRHARIVDAIPVPMEGHQAQVLLVEVDTGSGMPDTYVVPVLFGSGKRAQEIREWHADAVLAEVELTGKGPPKQGIIYDALEEHVFASSLLEGIGRRRTWKGQAGEFAAASAPGYRALRGEDGRALTPHTLRAEQSNSSVAFGERLMLKIFRRPVDGPNPELEVSGYLTRQGSFTNIAPVAGHIEYRRSRREPMTVGVLLGFVPNEGDAWRYTLDELKRYFERALMRSADGESPPGTRRGLLGVLEQNPPELVGEMMGGYIEAARLLGRRTAEMHLALAAPTDDPAFEPKPFTSLYQRSLYQSMRNLATRTIHAVGDRMGTIPDAHRPVAERLVKERERIVQAFRGLLDRKLPMSRIRIHGDYHLGQALYTGKDFVIVDFEGEPARPVGERRLKRSALHDVAGMLRSFDYAVHTLMVGPEGQGILRQEDLKMLEPWAAFWLRWVSSSYLRSYLHTAGDAAFIPAQRSDLELVLRVTTLEKAIYELGYELNNRPEWIGIPLRGTMQLLRGSF
ncbi:MAG: putative maltokinase, partial [Gemmatimonadales bacterium]